MRVPNTNTFSFKDVCDVVYPGLAYSGKTVRQAFLDANGIFNSSYAGNKDRLGNFRDFEAYFLNIQTEVMQFPLSPSTQYNTISSNYPNLSYDCPEDGTWLTIINSSWILEISCDTLTSGSRNATITIYSGITATGTITITQFDIQSE